MKRSAFTLVELLVVIAIIGLIASLSIIALSNARSKSRDSKRVSDIKQIQTALELFFSDQGRYPTATEWASGSLYATGTMGTTTYMDRIPSAPSTPDGTCVASENSFTYKPSADGSSYGITFCLGQATGSMAQGKKCATPGGITNDYCRTSLAAGTGTYTLGSFSMVSGEISHNGTFDTDTVWTKGSGVTISGGKVNINMAAGLAISDPTAYFYTGKRYRWSFTVTDYTSGNIALWGSAVSGYKTAVGTYSGETSYWPTNNTVQLYSTAGFVGSVDNISVVEISPLETITSGTQYLENTVAGTIGIPSTQAYGTWEFDIYKATDGNTLAVMPIHSQIGNYDATSNYSFVFSGSEFMHLGKESTSYFFTKSAYATYATWYRIKVVRNTSNQLYLYIKGGAFGNDYILASNASGGGGTNPFTNSSYTSSNYFSIDLDAGDRIANITLDGQLIYPSLP